MPKVFGIGLPRTGTTSLCSALDILGFRPAVHNPCSYEAIARCGSATDITIAWRFDRLAMLWPDARFIYTHRNMEDWLRSSERHFVKGWPKLAHHNYNNPDFSQSWAFIEATLAIFGTLEFSREVWTDAQIRHNNAIMKFFRQWSSRRVISIDVTKDIPDNRKWGKLCSFLGVPIPDVPFPHENKGVTR